MQRPLFWGATFAIAVVIGATPASVSTVPAPHLRLVPTALDVSGHLTSSPPSSAECLAHSGGRDTCYAPAQIQAAYNLAPLFAKGVNGTGETIVIVDAFGSPTIANDLKVFDTTFHLPAPPRFTIITPVGTVAPFTEGGTDRVGWAGETTLDVEWAHVMAPKAKLLLVETPTDEVEGTSGFPDIVTAENYVISHRLGTVISQSFAATESTFTSLAQITPLRSAYRAAQSAKITVLAGAGDWGSSGYELDARTLSTSPVTAWPATDPLVTAVGGTTLTLTSAGTRISPDVVWNDDTPAAGNRVLASGGGLSRFFSRPTYQNTVLSIVGEHRGVPDIAMSASCSAMVDVYESFAGSSGWGLQCGTSEATPLFAGIIALADQEARHGLGLINPALYALMRVAHNGIVDVTSGNNTVTVTNAGSAPVTVPGYDAATGYDLASGVGTVNAALFVPALVKQAASP